MAIRRLKADGHSLADEACGMKASDYRTLDTVTRTTISPLMGKTNITRGMRRGAELLDIGLLINNAHNANAATQYESFNLFRNNFARCSEKTVAAGSALTTQTEAILHNQQQLMDSGLLRSKWDRRLEERFAKTDWNDARSIERLRNECGDVFKRLDNDTDISGVSKLVDRKETELAVLMHLKDSAHFAEYITATEKQLKLAVDAYFTKLESNVGDIAKMLTNNGEKVRLSTVDGVDRVLNKASAGEISLSPAQIKTLNEWKSMLAVKGKKLDKYITGRIASGEINVEKIIEQGTFCGVTIDDKMANALRALDAFANVSNMNISAENAMLSNLGVTSTTTAMNYNSVADIERRITEFSKALEKSGVAGLNGISLDKMKLADLRLIDTSKLSDAQKQALNELIKLRSHGVNMILRQQAQRKLRGSVSRIAGRIMFSGNEELQQGYCYARSVVMLSQRALSIGCSAGKALPGATKVINKAKTVQKKITNTVVTNTKATMSSVVTGAKNAASKAINAQGSKTVKKAVNQAKKARNTIKVKKTTKAAKKASKSIIASAGASGGGLSALAGKATILLLALVLSFLMLLATLTLIGHSVRAVAQGMVTLDDMLFGWVDDIAGWVGSIEWPWEKRFEERKENLLEATIYGLEQEQANVASSSYWLDQMELDGKSYYGFINPESDFEADRVTNKSKETVDNNQTTFFYFNEKAEPITPYNTMKLVFSMTNAMIQPLSDNGDIDNFLSYSVGLWHHLNQFKVEAEMDICSGDGTYSYKCMPDDDGDYDDIYKFKVIKAKANGTVKISPIDSTDSTTEKASLCVVSKDGKTGVASKNTNGCRVTYYEGTGKSETRTVNGDKVISSSSKNGTQKFLDITNSHKDSWVYKESNKDASETALPTHTISVAKNKTFTYFLDPPIPDACKNDEWKGIFSSESKPKSLSSLTKTFTVCGNVNKCTNAQTKKCKGCVEQKENHGKGMSSACTCLTEKASKLKVDLSSENLPTELSGYVHAKYTCLGHTTQTYHNDLTISISHMSKQPCSNCERVSSNLRGITVTLYRCLGHDKVSYCITESDGYLHQACENCTVDNYTYDCPGYTEKTCPGHKVCLGHYTYNSCTGHYSCPGHTITYCTGHIKYNVIQTILSSENQEEWFKDWKYTELGEVLWWTTETTVDSAKLRKEYDREWDEDTKQIAVDTYEQDWFTVYDIKANRFDGSSISDAEIAKILDEWNVKDTNTEKWRKDFATAALKSVGIVPYYPGGEATSWDYNGNGFGSPVTAIKENNTMYSVKGIGRAQFADMVWWNYNETQPGVHKRNSRLRSLASSTVTPSVFPLCNSAGVQVSPGDVVFNLLSNNKVNHSYIVVGAKEDVLLVVGMGSFWPEVTQISRSEVRLFS